MHSVIPGQMTDAYTARLKELNLLLSAIFPSNTHIIYKKLAGVPGVAWVNKVSISQKTL